MPDEPDESADVPDRVTGDEARAPESALPTKAPGDVTAPEAPAQLLAEGSAEGSAEEPVETPAAAPAAAPPIAKPVAAPAKRAPAKKAAAKAAKRAPAKPAMAKPVPVEKTAAPATGVTAEQAAPPAKRPPARKAVKKSLAVPPPTPGPEVPAEPRSARPRTAPPPTPRRRPRAELPFPEAMTQQAPLPTAVRVAPSGERDGVVRFLVTLAVLLLAAAAGLGAAALVEHRETRYRADTVVRIEPGPAPTQPDSIVVALGVRKYATLAAKPAFTAAAAQHAGLARSAAEDDVVATAGGADEVRLTVSADSSRHARALAIGAGEALVELVDLQEAADQASAGDRLLPVVLGEPSAVTKDGPERGRVWLLALLAAGAVLVLAGVGAIVRFSRRS